MTHAIGSGLLNERKYSVALLCLHCGILMNTFNKNYVNSFIRFTFGDRKLEKNWY